MVKMNKKYKKKAIFSFLLVAVLMMCGCGKVNSDEVEASDASGTEEVSESEEDTVICWIAEDEKEKALAARGETYELAANETETSLASAGTVDTATGESEETELETSESDDTESQADSTGSSNSTGSTNSNTNSTKNSGSSSSGSDSNTGSSNNNTSTSSSSGSSTGSTTKTATATTTQAVSCTHNWQLTSTKAEEGYYTYHCTSSSHYSGHTGTKYIYVCNTCGKEFNSQSEMQQHVWDSEDENGWLTCGGSTIKQVQYTIDNTAWVTGTATKSWVTTSKGVYTYTCSKCGETKTETFTESHSSSTISFTIDPYNGENIDSWLNSHYN